MIERERLYELIVDAEDKCVAESPWCPDGARIEAVVEHLIKNGVILPPCKVGDTVWIVFSLKSSDKEKWFMTQDGVQGLLCGSKGFFIETWKMGAYLESQIGDTVFLTREEAEAELKKRRKEVNTT
jgi:hypothetical protein